jgi:hypothetical protein
MHVVVFVKKSSMQKNKGESRPFYVAVDVADLVFLPQKVNITQTKYQGNSIIGERSMLHHLSKLNTGPLKQLQLPFNESKHFDLGLGKILNIRRIVGAAAQYLRESFAHK